MGGAWELMVRRVSCFYDCLRESVIMIRELGGGQGDFVD